jgi:hypothetical protein
MFMQVLEEMINGGEREVAIDEGGMITEEPFQQDKELFQKEIRELVTYALEKDQNKLFNILLAMNSTVRHFKAANNLFLEVLRQRKLKGLLGA